MKIPAILASLVFATTLVSTITPAAGAPPPPRRHPGESIQMSVQRRLARLGYYHGRIDGEIGPHSHHAIRRYQADHGIPVTGDIDRPLLRSLGLL